LTKEKAAITNCLSNDLDLSEDGVARAKKRKEAIKLIYSANAG